MVERLAAMAAHLLGDFAVSSMTRDQLLRGVSYYRVHDFVELTEVIMALKAILKADTSVLISFDPTIDSAECVLLTNDCVIGESRGRR